MTRNKPLILDTGKTKQNSPLNDLDIPITDRVEMLERQMEALATFLAFQGFEIPDELTALL